MSLFCLNFILLYIVVYKDHRRRHCDVQVFWDQIESSGSINTSEPRESDKVC